MHDQPTATKRCRMCGEVKALTEFKGTARARDGRRHDCKACTYRPRAKDDPARRREWGRRWIEQNSIRHSYPNGRGFTDEDREVIALLRSDPCAYCGAEAGHVDHIEAGGDRDWTNLTATCHHCNSSKGDDRMLVWMLTVRRAYHDRDLIAVRVNAGETHRAIAADYGVSRPQITALMRQYRKERSL